MDVAVSGLPKWDCAGINAVDKSAKGQKVQCAVFAYVKAIAHCCWFVMVVPENF